ncbi:hypothetical protein P7C73_g6552, partial [Tremellales sp. Uapishka_1]
MSIRRSGSVNSRGLRTLTSPVKRMVDLDGEQESTDIHEQSRAILSLQSTVTELQQQIATHTFFEVEELRGELITSEQLFGESQRDNEQKHTTIEHQKQYVKQLESVLEIHLGVSWRVRDRYPIATVILAHPSTQIDHNVPTPLLNASTGFAASTPLPKPALHALRHSVSFSSKRALGTGTAAQKHARRSSAMEWGTLMKVNEEVAPPTPHTLDNTPTGAMRRLEGKPDTRLGVSLIDTPRTTRTMLSVPALSTAVTTPVRPEGQAEKGSQQLDEVAKMIAALPSLIQVSAAGREAQRVATIKGIVDSAERRADEREARLRAMLAAVQREDGRSTAV